MVPAPQYGMHCVCASINKTPTPVVSQNPGFHLRLLLLPIRSHLHQSTRTTSVFCFFFERKGGKPCLRSQIPHLARRYHHHKSSLPNLHSSSAPRRRDQKGAGVLLSYGNPTTNSLTLTPITLTLTSHSEKVDVFFPFLPSSPPSPLSLHTELTYSATKPPYPGRKSSRAENHHD